MASWLNSFKKGKADDSLELFDHYPQELHFNALNDESNAVNQVVKSAVENYRTFLKMLDDLRKQKIDPNAKNEQGISYAEAIQSQFNSVRFLTALRNNKFRCRKSQ
ncbi:exonuclease V (RecBCD complex), alpha chain [Haemophilus influenzae]|uniref:Exonuclease V (RecBCD complex), alpha chain n=1 Tax=Haemophilus influenzae TaxID=727 RepID=A0A2X1RN52_HAEIF|nr:exonuclease V (RecBCD complex), alpha chain [Haemophilus influenzae]